MRFGASCVSEHRTRRSSGHRAINWAKIVNMGFGCDWRQKDFCERQRQLNAIVQAVAYFLNTRPLAGIRKQKPRSFFFGWGLIKRQRMKNDPRVVPKAAQADMGALLILMKHYKRKCSPETVIAAIAYPFVDHVQHLLAGSDEVFAESVGLRGFGNVNKPRALWCKAFNLKLVMRIPFTWSFLPILRCLRLSCGVNIGAGVAFRHVSP